MSWFTRLRDAYETFQTAGLYNARQSRHQEADIRYQMQDQMKAYKDATELTRQEIERKRGEEKAEKRRIEEKQIRTLRGRLRPQGIMNNQSLGSAGNPATGTTTKLGA